MPEGRFRNGLEEKYGGDLWEQNIFFPERNACHFFLWTLWFEEVRLVPWQLSQSSVRGSRPQPSTELRAGTWLLELLLMHCLHQDFPSRPWSSSYITGSPGHSTWHRHSRFKMPSGYLSGGVNQAVGYQRWVQRAVPGDRSLHVSSINSIWIIKGLTVDRDKRGGHNIDPPLRLGLGYDGVNSVCGGGGFSHSYFTYICCWFF